MLADREHPFSVNNQKRKGGGGLKRTAEWDKGKGMMGRFKCEAKIEV